MPYYEPHRRQWRGQIIWSGKRYRKSFPTKREALEWEAAARRKLRSTDPRISALTTSKFVAEYLKVCEQRFSRKTIEEKLAMADRFLNAVGEIPVQNVTPRMIHDLLMERLKVSADAYNKNRKNLLAMWHWGEKVLGLTENPVSRIEKMPYDMPLQYTPSHEEVERLFEVATREEKVLLTTFISTAGRKTEILGLKWVDVDFDRHRIRLSTHKTADGSIRHDYLPMSDQLLGNLWWWWHHRHMEKSPYVFKSANYKQTFRYPRLFMARLCRRANTTGFGFHALRRYAASVLAETPGISLRAIQKIMRHRKLQTTERYLYDLGTDLIGPVNVLGEKITPKKNPHKSQPPDNSGGN